MYYARRKKEKKRDKKVTRWMMQVTRRTKRHLSHGAVLMEKTGREAEAEGDWWRWRRKTKKKKTEERRVATVYLF